MCLCDLWIFHQIKIQPKFKNKTIWSKITKYFLPPIFQGMVYGTYIKTAVYITTAKYAVI